MTSQEKSNLHATKDDQVIRLLLAEDELFWANFLIWELNQSYPNIEIIHAKNGEEAVEYIKKSMQDLYDSEIVDKYDAIITDIQMPLMDGCQAVRIIRDLMYERPIIVWSAYRESSEDLKRALNIPVNGFCVKKADVQNVIRSLKNLKIID